MAIHSLKASVQSGIATQAKSLLGFAPRVALREGIQRTIAWYRQEMVGATA